jgi:hypothetical protein
MAGTQQEPAARHAAAALGSRGGERGGDLAELANGMARHLEAVYTVHGLSRRELLGVHRGIAKLQRAGAAPSANEFWETTALPRARALTYVARAALDSELAEIGAALELAGNRLVVADQRLEPISASDLARPLLAALPSGDAIDRLGRWWQRRLRRAATVRALPSIALRVPAQAELAIASAEMQLLDRPPWSHGDRLLSAFEIAHAEIATYGRRRIAEQAAASWAAATGS